jgi:hypothetical protein
MVYEIFSQFGKVSEVIIKGSQVNNRLQRQNGHGFIRFDGGTYEEGIEAAVRATKVIQQVLINEVLYDCVLSHSVTAAASALPNNRSPASGHYGSENVFTQPVVSSSRLTLYPSDDMRSYELRSYQPCRERLPSYSAHNIASVIISSHPIQQRSLVTDSDLRRGVVPSLPFFTSNSSASSLIYSSVTSSQSSYVQCQTACIPQQNSFSDNLLVNQQQHLQSEDDGSSFVSCQPGPK